MKEENLGIKIGTIISVQKVDGTDRLCAVKIDIGDKVIQIAMAVPSYFERDYLIGKQVPIKIDVSPIKIRGIESQARFLTTINENKKTILLMPEQKVPNGSEVW